GSVIYFSKLPSPQISMPRHFTNSDKSFRFVIIGELTRPFRHWGLGHLLHDFDKNHKNRNYDSAVLSAPIEIAENRWICSVVITKKEDNRFYLHEVVEQKKAFR
ncbi:MAG: hypothetical protein II277_03335, partial [Bacteroidales bacterium]|nr:hypothetical protein [Bacteroidales bacterium]